MSKQFELGQQVHITCNDVVEKQELAIITEVLPEHQAYRVLIYSDGNQWVYHETEIKELK